MADEQRDVHSSVKKGEVASIINEYFTTGNVDWAVSKVRELGSSEYHPYFIQRLLYMAIQRHGKEKEMAWVLVSAVYPDVITSAHIVQGLFLLLGSVNDTEKPEAAGILCLFIARSLVILILPPALVSKAKKSLFEGVQFLQHDGGGEEEVVDHYIVCEAFRCIKQLGVKVFHHEIVKKALLRAMKSRANEPLILNILKEASVEGLISSSQMVAGFSSCLLEILDDPSAKSMFDSLVQHAVAHGWLDVSFVTNAVADGWLDVSFVEFLLRERERKRD